MEALRAATSSAKILERIGFFLVLADPSQAISVCGQCLAVSSALRGDRKKDGIKAPSGDAGTTHTNGNDSNAWTSGLRRHFAQRDMTVI
jgi:hypothetical protein